MNYTSMIQNITLNIIFKRHIKCFRKKRYKNTDHKFLKLIATKHLPFYAPH